MCVYCSVKRLLKQPGQILQIKVNTASRNISSQIFPSAQSVFSPQLISPQLISPQHELALINRTRPRGRAVHHPE